MPANGRVVIFGLDVVGVLVDEGELALEEGGVVVLFPFVGHAGEVFMVKHHRGRARRLLCYKHSHGGLVAELYNADR